MIAIAKEEYLRCFSKKEFHLQYLDFYQEALVKILLMEESKPVKNEIAYFRKIVRHCMLDYIRKKKLDITSVENEHKKIRKITEYSRWQIIEAMTKVVDYKCTFTKREQTLWNLMSEGTPVAEIKEIMNLELDSVRSCRSRVARKIKEQLEAKDWLLVHDYLENKYMFQAAQRV